MKRLEKSFNKDDISSVENKSIFDETISNYKKKKETEYKQRLSFNDVLLIYIKFLKNEKVQNQKFVNLIDQYILTDQNNSHEQISKIRKSLKTHKEMFFMLKAIILQRDNIDAWKLNLLWENIEDLIITNCSMLSFIEFELLTDFISELGLISAGISHEYEEMILDSKSEIFSVEREQIFNRLYKIIQFFTNQKEIRSEFFFEISHWTQIMFR